MFNGRSVSVASIGAYAPEKRLTNFDLEKIVNTSDEWITSRSGIKERRVAEPDCASSDLMAKAARVALERSGVESSSIQMVIACTATPDMLFPPTACLVQQKLGLPEAVCFDLEAGCSGFLYGVSVASQFVATGSMNNILVVGGDVLTRIVNWEDRNTCVLFGDGAGAAVITPGKGESGIMGFNLNADGNLWRTLFMPAGGSKIPASEESVKNKLHTVSMEGKEVFRHAVTKMSESASALMSRLGITVDDISHYIPHQANVRIIESVAKRLGVPEEKVVLNLDRYGNTSCGSIPLAWNEAFETGRLKKGDILLFTAAGAGLTWGSMILRWGV